MAENPGECLAVRLSYFFMSAVDPGKVEHLENNYHIVSHTAL